MKKTIILRTVCTVLIIAAIAVPIIAFGGGNASETEESAVLKIGSSGTQVRTLQTKLNNWGYDAVTYAEHVLATASAQGLKEEA